MLKRTLIGIIRSHEQTGEKASDPLLRTHYYRLSKEKAWDEVINMLKKMPKYKVMHQIENLGEIVVEKRTATGRIQDVTIMLFSINPVRTAIDIYSASRGSLGDLGSNYRTILELFQQIDNALKSYKVT